MQAQSKQAAHDERRTRNPQLVDAVDLKQVLHGIDEQHGDDGHGKYNLSAHIDLLAVSPALGKDMITHRVYCRHSGQRYEQPLNRIQPVSPGQTNQIFDVERKVLRQLSTHAAEQDIRSFIGKQQTAEPQGKQKDGHGKQP